MRKFNLTLLSLLILSNFAFALRPSKDYKNTPKDFDMDYKDISIPTEDGLTLKGWYFKPMENTKKYIVVCDDGEGNMADNLEIISQFLTLDYHVITFDFRGFGKSSEFEIDPKKYIYPHFVKDMNAVIKYMRKYYTTTFDIYGIGMGAGLALSIAANKTEIRKVIADAPYVSFAKMKSQLKAKKDIEVSMPTVYNKYYMEPIHALANKGKHLTGILYIVGGNDVIVSNSDIKELVKIKKKPSHVYVVKGATNTENFTSNKEAYFEHIKKFLHKGK
ncbi:alpha/beta fold hydrolase [Bacteroidales bacterium AH-315-N07]|nr:alpha/beta fold hydrolase [Bacteroidales bacterium AH-315-N07]